MCWQPSDGPLVVRAGSYEAVRADGWLGWRAGGSLEGQPVASGHSWARPATPDLLTHCEVREDLAGDVALEDAHDLAFGSAFREAAFDVGTGAGFGGHAGEHDAP